MKKVGNNIIYCPLLEQVLRTIENHALFHILQASACKLMYVLHIHSVLSSYHKHTLEHISIQSFQLYFGLFFPILFIRITCIYLGYYYFYASSRACS
jgi:hypothetical protein